MSGRHRPQHTRTEKLKKVFCFFFLKKTAARRAILALSLLFSAQGQARANTPEQLLWASDGQANVPFVFHDPAHQGKMAGFEYEIVEALGKKLGMTPKFIQNDWDGLIPGLQRGMYGMVLDGIEMTPEHQAAVLFSRPYYVTAERITLRRDEPDLDSVEKLHGRVVGTLRDTLAERILRRDPSVTLRTYEEETNAYTDLRDGRLDAVLLDGPIAQYYGETQSDLKVVGAPIGRVAYGIAFAPSNHALHDKVDAALGDLMADGTIHRILARWGMWTPQMAAETGDHSTPDIMPTAWDAYRASLAPAAGVWGKIVHYAGFLPLILHGALITLAVSALAMILAVMLGLVLALTRRYGPRPLAWAGTTYVEIVRGTPLLIQILFIFYGLPALGLRLSPFVAGVIALGLNYAAYEAENYRAGLSSVPRGQIEAAIALNFTHMQALRLVVVPQAFRIVVPVMTNDFISLLKDSSLVSVITLTELSETYVRLSATYYDYIGPGLMVGIAYLLLGLPFVRLARWAEKRMGRAVTR